MEKLHNMDAEVQRIEAALGSMTLLGPRSLVDYLRQPTPDFSPVTDKEVWALINRILSDDPNDPPRLRFSSLLRGWDNAKDPSWANGTLRNTDERRNHIHELLKLVPSVRSRIDASIPFFRLEEPLIISEAHTEWYDPTQGLRDYYWQSYKQYLREKKAWDDKSLLGLDNTTRAVLECLANPESREAYASRGLVMGYVQSGKTANFAGVIARSADAGYRLIIVLAGTWNILRNQTQRRLDKELLGKELLQNDESYLNKPPTDWDEFLEHGFDPKDQGIYTWQRLTRPDIDFKRLKSAIDNLEFERREQGLPLYHPSNLHALPAKLLVVKKHSGILRKLVKDLKLLSTKLTDLPALIIDDESDQAGLNTVDPRMRNASSKERSKTNEAIVDLLGLLPRGQYIGYTATPYANALVDPDDPEDLFPKDFIVSLDRPIGYMGVLDFFDPEVDFSNLYPADYRQKEIAFIRRVESPQGTDDQDLQLALRSYVLSGALKLYREMKDPKHYSFRHHTMLIHTSSSTASQADLAERVTKLWNKCAFNLPTGLALLRTLWESDFEPVCQAQGPRDHSPSQFDELIPFLAEAIDRIEKGGRYYMIVNYNSKEAPDFGEEPVWKIIIGGNKLSRGYTVEGLTVSYYRRVASTADTLMQMGRWFGFRRGYRDLVRVFLGVKEGKKNDVDLVGLFKQVCLMEERFRQEITRYIRVPGEGRVTPKQVPPLISVVGQLPPTSRNKMFNASVESKNYGGRWSMPTMLPAKPETLEHNLNVTLALLKKSDALERSSFGGTYTDGIRTEWSGEVFRTTNLDIIQFLRGFRWLETEYKHDQRPTDIHLQIEFLEKVKHEIDSWLIVAPQVRKSTGSPFSIGDLQLSVITRTRTNGSEGRFKVFGDPRHRAVAEYWIDRSRISDLTSKVGLESANDATAAFRSKHRGVMLLYPAREQPASKISAGFELLFPENNLGFDVNFTVRKKNEIDRVTIAA